MIVRAGNCGADASRAVTLQDAAYRDLVLLLDDVGELQRHFVQRRAGRDGDAVLLQVIAEDWLCARDAVDLALDTHGGLLR